MILRVRRIPKIAYKFAIPIRYNSTKDKYSSIEEFNKNKTKYNYGYNFDSLDKLDAKINPDHVNKPTTPQRSYAEAEEDKPMDINAIIESDPRLLNFKPGTAEYRDELRKIHAEFLIKQQNQQKNHEFRQRMKAVIVGFLAFVGIISAHQIFMNYDSLKNRLLMNYTYGDVQSSEDKTKVTNTKSTKYLLEKLTKELSDDHLNQIQNSKEVTGVYVFGNDTKIPLRIPFFNDMILKDVYVERGHLVAVSDNGKVYEWKKGWSDARLINLPYNVDKVTPTNDYFYFLTSKGEVVFIPRNKSDTKFVPLQRRNWFGLLKTQNYNKLNVKNIKEIEAGANHLLLLDKQGQVYVVNSSERPSNRGQFGSVYSPFDNKEVPVNTPIDLTLLNHKFVRNTKGEKVLVPRVFESIAAGKYFNLVSDDEGDIWTWGENSSGQCGNLNTKEVKPIPQPAFAKDDLKRVLRNVIPLAKTDLIQIKKLAAGDETAYALINYLDKDILIAFGNGLNGQLGGSRYMQVCCWPEITKSLLDMTEFDESINSIKTIGIKDISVGNKHLFITLNNVGQFKDVYAVGENIMGQLGNGKKTKTCKPIKLPRLLEPEDKSDRVAIVQNLTDVNTKRLLLLDNWSISKKPVDQVIKAGDDTSVIFYKHH